MDAVVVVVIGIIHVINKRVSWVNWAMHVVVCEQVRAIKNATCKNEWNEAADENHSLETNAGSEKKESLLTI